MKKTKAAATTRKTILSSSSDSFIGWLRAAVTVVFLTASVGCLAQSSVSPSLTSTDCRPAAAGCEASSRVLWGVWDILIGAADGSVTAVPDRSLEFTINAVKLLQPPKAPTQLLTYFIDPVESDLANGKVVCDITLRHPYPASKFCGFDVMGILMDKNPGSTIQSDPGVNVSLPPSGVLQNPDGYTRWWNMPEFTTFGTIFGYTHGAWAKGQWQCLHTLNPFKYFSDDLEPEEAFLPDISARGFFASSNPGQNTRRYILQFPKSGSDPVFHFKYAVAANWAEPYGNASPPYTADEFPPHANMPEAFRIGFVDTDSTAYYENETSFGGDLSIYLEVFDWQLDGSAGSVLQEIAGVTIESPTLFESPVELDIGKAELIPGNEKGVRIPAVVKNVTPTGLENQLLIVTVRSAKPTTYEPQVPGISGFAFPDAPLAAYNILKMPIKSVPPPGAWDFTVVAQGTFNSNHALALDSKGRPFIAYREWNSTELEFKWFNGMYWHKVYGKVPVFFVEGIALDSSGNVNILYAPMSPAGVEVSRYKWPGWSTWLLFFEWPGTNSSIAVDQSDHPHVALCEQSGPGTVWHFWNDGSSWQNEGVAFGKMLMPSIAIDKNNRPHITANETSGASTLYHYYYNGSGWVGENLGVGGNSSHIRIDSQNHLHLAFSTGAEKDAVNNLGYGYFDGTEWHFEVVDSSSDLRMPSLALDSQDRPHISYWDKTSASLKYAHFNGVKWAIETLVQSGVNSRSSICILSNDRPAIAYVAQEGDTCRICITWKT